MGLERTCQFDTLHIGHRIFSGDRHVEEGDCHVNRSTSSTVVTDARMQREGDPPSVILYLFILLGASIDVEE